jgi:N-acetylglucosaminyl-diphospho-decaprenol L-rhamnosyltransferase
MTVYVVIPTFNRREALATCLECLERQTVAPVVVVSDSASSDGTAEMIRERHPAVILCHGAADLWWTGTINLGIRHVLQMCGSDDWIVCQNDDTVFAADWIERLLQAAARGPRRVVGSVAADLSDPLTVLDGGNRMDWLTAATQRKNIGRPLADFAPGYEEAVNVLPGRGVLYPARAFRDLGLFAEKRLPQGGADYEFAARCQRSGYDLVVAYDAVVLSRTEMTGMHAPSRIFSASQAYQYFFSRRSYGNLRFRFHFAFLTRRSYPQALVFLGCSWARLIAHYFLAKPSRPSGAA